MSRPPTPPFTAATAAAKVQAAEDAWNTRDPELVVQAYTVDSRWRNRFGVHHRPRADHGVPGAQVGQRARLRPAKELWAYTDDRITVTVPVRVARRRRAVVAQPTVTRCGSSTTTAT